MGHPKEALLQEMKAAVEGRLRARAVPALAARQYAALLARYKELLAIGLAGEPTAGSSPRISAGGSNSAPARNLLERLLAPAAAGPRLPRRLTIPFDNNQAERDLRMLKTQQKISGSFRAETGCAAFARLRGYLSSTLRKQGVALLAALADRLHRSPLYPALG